MANQKLHDRLLDLIGEYKAKGRRFRTVMNAGGVGLVMDERSYFQLSYHQADFCESDLERLEKFLKEHEDE